jgi:hemerythrin-like metal-binding protein
LQYVKWIHEKYSVNIKIIDEQHQVLVEIINEVYRAKMDDSGKKAIADIIAKLIQYTKTHFAMEENLMKEYGFSYLEAHSSFHRVFESKVEQFFNDFKSNEELLSDDILQFLRDWLLNHIMNTDKIYATYLNGKGVF